jgi:hypothetical protein
LEEVEIALPGKFRKKFTPEEFFSNFKRVCPFCKQDLSVLNRKKTLLGCKTFSECEAKFVAVLNLKVLFYFDKPSFTDSNVIFDVSVDFTKGITQVRKYLKKETLFILDGTMNPYDPDDVDSLNDFLDRICKILIFE